MTDLLATVEKALGCALWFERTNYCVDEAWQASEAKHGLEGA